jgi:hypothetical protein
VSNDHKPSSNNLHRPSNNQQPSINPKLASNNHKSAFNELQRPSNDQQPSIYPKLASNDHKSASNHHKFASNNQQPSIDPKSASNHHKLASNDELLDHLPGGLFLPDGNNLLVAWIGDGKRYSKGSRLHATNYEKQPSNDQLWLTGKAASYMRHIRFTHKVHIASFPSLMNCFLVLLLGRSLRLEEFPSISTLSASIYCLQLFDWQFFLNQFIAKITTPNQHGFPGFWYFITDDSKHHKEDRHAALMSALEGNEPFFKLLTTMIGWEFKTQCECHHGHASFTCCGPLWGQRQPQCKRRNA